MKKAAVLFLCLLMITSMAANAAAIDKLDSIADCLIKTVENPTVSAVGGEWAIIGLARSDMDIPNEYFEKYYENVQKYVESKNGVLHSKKHTEYSRVILALTAIGKNPGDVSEYNLLTPLGDFEKTLVQGINGAVWALIALDSANYEIPDNPYAAVQATREMYVGYILERQHADGGWSLSGEHTDIDVTAMVLQALSKYRDNKAVNDAIENALVCVSAMQNENGGFSSKDTENSESCAQVIVALAELGIPLDNSKYVKNGKTLMDNLETYYVAGEGYKHTYDENSANIMATEQCFYALVAAKRFCERKNSLYKMSDVISTSETENTVIGNNDKKSENSLEYNMSMARDEFSAIISRGIGLNVMNVSSFSDITKKGLFYKLIK